MRRPSWPPCGEDPVLWRSVNTRPVAGPIARTVGALLTLALAFCLLVGTYWFAKPAFQELVAWGYRPMVGSMRFLEVSPFAMAFSRGNSERPPLGVGRLEFNGALRQFTLLWNLLYVLMLTGIAVEGITSERVQDTWTSLLTTPLTGRQIVRGKMLGAAWRVRWGAGVMVALWTIGLAAGAVHPLGYLTAIAGLAASTWFLVALGTYHSLRERDVQTASNRTMWLVMALLFMPLLLLILPRASATILLGIGSMPFQSYLSLVSYEDVRIALRRGRYPSLYAIHLNTGATALWVLATCLIGLIGQSLAAAWLTRTMYRGFDTAVGRPIRRSPIHLTTETQRHREERIEEPAYRDSNPSS